MVKSIIETNKKGDSVDKKADSPPKSKKNTERAYIVIPHDSYP
jgi:hypothetical protein